MTDAAGGGPGLPGRLAVVGLGPGDPAQRTAEVAARLDAATDLVGYEPYLDLVGPLAGEPRRHPSDNRQEDDRARFAMELAAAGRDVVVVSSGDPGVFAMATAVVEQLERVAADERFAAVDLTILPGVSAAMAAAARLGAPLGHDFCVVSLSDVLKPWEVVERRLDAAAGADFVLALYNPISRHRPWQLGRALEVVARHRDPATPVVLATAVGRPDERSAVLPLGDVDPSAADMSTIVLVGSSSTRRFEHRGRTWVYTPRRHPG